MNPANVIASFARVGYRLLCGSICPLVGLFLFASIPCAHSLTDRDCLSCHKDPSLKQVCPDGGVRSLYVDPDEWKADIHRERGLSCVDCHTDATLFSHPVGGYRGNQCALCHSEHCEEYFENSHIVVSGAVGEQSIACFDCHTKHSVRPKDDPSASVSAGNIAGLCSSCHPAEAASDGLFSRIAFFRVSGHRKEDVSTSYDMSSCADCHFRDGAHGQPGQLAERCATCHRKGAEFGTVFSRSVHATLLFGGGGVVAVQVFYGLILIGAVGGGAAILLRKRETSRGGDDSTQ